MAGNQLFRQHLNSVQNCQILRARGKTSKIPNATGSGTIKASSVHTSPYCEAEHRRAGREPTPKSELHLHVEYTGNSSKSTNTEAIRVSTVDPGIADEESTSGSEVQFHEEKREIPRTCLCATTGMSPKKQFSALSRPSLCRSTQRGTSNITKNCTVEPATSARREHRPPC